VDVYVNASAQVIEVAPSMVNIAEMVYPAAVRVFPP
jgi:hypothetical protein